AGLRAVKGLDHAGFAMDEDAVFGDDANLNAPAGQELVQASIAHAMKQRFDLWRWLVPTFLQRRFAHVFRYGHVRCVQFAVANDLERRDRRNLFPDKLENGTSEIPGDTPVAPGLFQSCIEECVIETFAARGKTVDNTHSCPEPPKRWFFMSS